jgi:hypothetical protein
MTDPSRALALWCSPAVLVEPSLLRRLRLRLCPDLRAGDEADLWWSSLVDSRSPSGIVLRAEVAEELRNELRARVLAGDERPRIAWSEIEGAHRATAPAVRLEEEIAWLAVSETDPAPAIEARIHQALAGLVNEERTGLATWTARALPRLPDVARRTPAAWYLEQASRSYLADGARLGTTTPTGVDVDALSAMLAQGLRARLGVLRVGDLLLLGDVGPDGEAIEVPTSEPRLVKVEPGVSQGRKRRVRPTPVAIVRDSVVRMRVGREPVTVHSGTGASYVLDVSDYAHQIGADLVVQARDASTGVPLPGFVLDDDLVLVAGPVRGSDIVVEGFPARPIKSHLSGLTTLRVPGVRARRSLRRNPHPVEMGRRWYGTSPHMAGLVRGSDTRGLRLERSGDEEVPRGTPVVVDGEIVGVVLAGILNPTVGARSEPDLHCEPWQSFHPEGSDPGAYRAALGDFVQGMCLEFHVGLRSLGVEELVDDLLDSEQFATVKGLAEWIVKPAVEALTAVRPETLAASLGLDLLVSGHLDRGLVDELLTGLVSDRDHSEPPSVSAVRRYAELSVGWDPRDAFDVSGGAAEEAAESLRREHSGGRSRWHVVIRTAGDAATASTVADGLRLGGGDVTLIDTPASGGLPAEATVLVVYLTPDFLASPSCRADLEAFVSSPLFPRVRRLVLVDPVPSWEGYFNDPPVPAFTVLPNPGIVVSDVLEIVYGAERDGVERVFRDAATHLECAWRRERDRLAELRVPFVTYDEDLAAFLDAYLGHVARILRQSARIFGAEPFSTGFPLNLDTPMRLPLDQYDIEVGPDLANRGDSVSLTGPFQRFVDLFEWAVAELVAEIGHPESQTTQHPS